MFNHTINPSPSSEEKIVKAMLDAAIAYALETCNEILDDPKLFKSKYDSLRLINREIKSIFACPHNLDCIKALKENDYKISKSLEIIANREIREIFLLQILLSNGCQCNEANKVITQVVEKIDQRKFEERMEAMKDQNDIIRILENMRVNLNGQLRDDIIEISSCKEYRLLDRKYGISETYKEFVIKISEALDELKKGERK